MKAIKEKVKKIDKSDIVDMYIKIAFADLNDFLEFGKKTTVNKNGEEEVVNDVSFKKDCIDKIDTTAISSVTNSSAGVKLTLYDRMKALEWLGKYFDETETEEKKEAGVIIIPDIEKIREKEEQLKK